MIIMDDRRERKKKVMIEFLTSTSYLRMSVGKGEERELKSNKKKGKLKS